MSLYIIAIGGTGAKFVEALAHVAAAGFLDEEPVNVLFVDPDESNGHLDRARNTLRVYQSCHQLLSAQHRGDSQECPWMKTPFATFAPNDVWSPVGKQVNKNLSSLFNYHNYQPIDPLRNLFDALYPEKERELSLDMGFRGRPAIGAAVMSQLNTLADDPWNTFFARISGDVGAGSHRSPKIFLCGSAFGGTGAAGFPTIGRLITNRLEQEGLRNQPGEDNKDKVKLGGALLLPYFRYEVPPEFNAEEEICARPEQFLLNTEAALRYYRKEAQRTFDTIYLLGSPAPSKVNNFSLGKGDQRNTPHFIEFYAALAVRHFLGHTSTDRGQAVVIRREKPERVTWTDLPPGVKPQLVQTTRFALAWITAFRGSFSRAKESFDRFSKVAPWATEFFYHKVLGAGLPKFEREYDLIKPIDDWCEDYLRWLGSLHDPSQSIQLQLFNRNAFLDESGQLRGDDADFWRLVAASGSANPDDTVARLERKLKARVVGEPNRGLVGLARALYVICEEKGRK